MEDKINHPKHYVNHPSGIECIEITQYFDFCIGNAIKYLWRAGIKDENTTIEDLQKAIWYINKKIALLINKDEEEHDILKLIDEEIGDNIITNDEEYDDTPDSFWT